MPQRKRYHILNRVNHQKAFVVATNATTACQKTGWLIGDCFIMRVEPLAIQGRGSGLSSEGEN